MVDHVFFGVEVFRTTRWNSLVKESGLNIHSLLTDR